MRRAWKCTSKGRYPTLGCSPRRRGKAFSSPSAAKTKAACRVARPTACGKRSRKRSCGRSAVRRTSNVVYTQCESLGRTTGTDFAYLAPIDTSRQTLYSFGIVNKGAYPVVVKLEISPNAVDFAQDSEEVVGGGRTTAVVPIRYLRYARLGIRSQVPGQTSVVDVYYQAQSSG